MKKYICVHGHFYQPPRENAWLEKIEYQDSATPYHDWNERITSECYGPNGVSRILNDEGRIVDIVNNYSRMSFNFGPTLLSWLEEQRPATYSRILEADRLSMNNFGGHGSAMAQVYNHIIMPLANRRDKETQVVWGLRDFEYRFKRKAEGMWLAETAVDTETLEVLAENGVKFTVLAPRQAKRYRPLDAEKEWTDGIDTKCPYLCKLPSGKSIVLFFYDGDRSQAVAFKGLLKDGKEFANYLVDAFDERDENQLVNIATDGESYGHHHRYGDMALAYCIRYIETNKLATVCNYSQYLELCPPDREVEIHENSSWSCIHGVERWRTDCGCNAGSGINWNQKWRQPLRRALDDLRNTLTQVYIESMHPYHKDPWALRNAYIDIILERTPEKVNAFLNENFGELNDRERTHIMRLLEMQRHELLMFTSCGWFFDEISGIETIQILQYAARAIQLAESESDYEIEADFKNQLAAAQSNIDELGNGKDIYEKKVKPSSLTLTHIGMHYAVSSLFADDPDAITVFNYNCKSTEFRRIAQGGQRLAVGRTHVDSRVTLSQKDFSFVVLYMGQHHLVGMAFERIPLDEFTDFSNKVIAAFQNSNVSEVLELYQTFPEHRSFSFFDMYKDEQIKMLNRILENSLELAATSYQKINVRNYNLINVMKNAQLQPPRLLVHNLEMTLNNDLRNSFSRKEGRINVYKLKRIIKDIKRWNFKMDHTELNFICANKLNSMLVELGSFTNGNAEKSREMVINIQDSLALLARVGIVPELNEIQDVIFTYLKNLDPEVPIDIRTRLLEFAAYINIDVQFLSEKKEFKIE